MIDIKNKTALITGASRGIGFHIALSLAQRGCHLFLHSRKKEHLLQVVEACKPYGTMIYSVSANLEHIDDVDLMIDEIIAMGNPIDILINNAGIQPGYRANYWQTPIDDFTKSFAVNTLAPARICHRLMPLMIERDFGRVINITSGIRNEPQQAGYSASKAALDKISFDLGYSVNGSNVMLSVVDPGWCQTDMGGANAPNKPESALPGAVAGVFLDDRRSPRYISAQDFSKMSLEESVQRIQDTDQYLIS